MENIPDDPIVRCIERAGYPPWMNDGGYDPENDFDEGEDSDVYYGSESESF